jgi:SAM-dependent methyltransferase
VPPSPEWRTTLIAHAALETGLLAAYGTPSTPAAAAAAAGLDERATRIVSAALVGSGHLRAVGGVLALTDDGAALVDPPTPDHDPAGELHLEARAVRSHLRLAEVLVTGAPADDVSAGDRPTRERFMRAMRAIAGPRADETAVAIGPPRGHGRLLDVGGAPGTYARRLTAAGWEVTVLDLPEMLELEAPALAAAGVASVAGDATAGLPAGPWDAVYLGNVLHLFDPVAAEAVIARAAAALAPHGLLAVQEVLGDRSPQGPSFGVMMLLSTRGGDAHGEGDYRRWMGAAGCPPERVVAIADGWHHLLLGRRAA